MSVIHIDKFIVDASGRKKHLFTCNECGKDRGFCNKDNPADLCYECAIIKRNKTLLITDAPSDDFIRVKTEKLYKTSCPTCDKDRGYITKHDRYKNCLSCAKKIAHTNKPIDKTKILRSKLRHNMKSSINRKLRFRLSSKAGKSTFNILPYTVDDLIKHLESKFKDGMTWDNHGMYGWHIDHIKPDSSFTYSSVEDEEFQLCWALDNLQPLWAKENLTKSDTFTG